MTEVIIHISSGVIQNLPAFNRAISELDGRYVVKITKANKRSLNQNAYYWTIVELVKDALRNEGYRELKSKGDVHEFLKDMFIRKKIVNEITGEILSIPGSTAKLTTVEFSDYINEIIKWAGEYLSIALPLPGQQSEMFY